MRAFDPSRDCAARLDAADSLACFRSEFALPLTADGQPLIYLAGHSLGLAPLATKTLVNEELDDWQRLGVMGHEQSRRPWFHFDEFFTRGLSALCGARSDEVAALNSLSANLHFLLAAFYQPTKTRHRILVEAGAFSSDRHVASSQLRWHGLSAEQSLIELMPRVGEDLLRIEDIERAIAEAGDSLALVLWPGVQYRTGQAFDMQRIAASTSKAGAILCLDIAHAIGNVPLSLHDWNVDCAAWCSYKYLNAGPGAIGGAFVHRRHFANPALRPLLGWWGHERESRLQLSSEYRAAHGIAAWAVSNPPILAAAPLLASLEQFERASSSLLRAKSLQLTSWLEYLLKTRCGESLQQLTSTNQAERGAQLSVRVRGGNDRARAVFRALLPLRLIADWREPDIIRIAPVPLYNSYDDVWLAVEVLQQALTKTP